MTGQRHKWTEDWRVVRDSSGTYRVCQVFFASEGTPLFPDTSDQAGRFPSVAELALALGQMRAALDKPVLHDPQDFNGDHPENRTQ